ncbi:MAG: hypothetical protein RLZZ546_1098 [Bacteroidota bacterium]|jgi:hypothetical protein
MLKCKVISIILLLLISCSSPKTNQTDFEFLTLGIPENRNSLDTNELGAKFYLRTMSMKNSMLLKFNVVDDDLLMESNDSIFNSKIKPEYFYAKKDTVLARLLRQIEYRYKNRENGTLKENTFDGPAIYNGGTYFFRFTDQKGQERYFSYKLTNMQDPLKSFHYYIIEKYYHKKFERRVAKAYVNTDSIMLEFSKKKNIKDIPRVPKIIEEPIRFIAPGEEK